MIHQALSRSQAIHTARESLVKLIEPQPIGEPLPVTLATMVKPSNQAGTGGPAVEAAHRNAIDLDASKVMATLQCKVAKEVRLPASAGAESTKLAKQMKLMVTLAIKDEQDDEPLLRAARILSWAVEQIRELLEPTPVSNLQGACPECGASKVLLPGDAG